MPLQLAYQARFTGYQILAADGHKYTSYSNERFWVGLQENSSDSLKYSSMIEDQVDASSAGRAGEGQIALTLSSQLAWSRKNIGAIFTAM